MAVADVAVAGQARTRRILRHSALGLVARGGSVAAVFAAMPLMLASLGTQAMGAWLVLLSVFQWVTFFDFGVAAGARNEIARAAASGDLERVSRTLYTGWAFVLAVAAALFAVAALLLTATPLAAWAQSRVFGGQPLGAALWVAAAAACCALALGYIQSVYAALERGSAFALFSLLANGLFLALLWLATRLGGGSSVTQVALLYTAAIVAANLTLIAAFWSRHPELRPRAHRPCPSLRRAILDFGMRLFLIQLAALVLFSLDRLLVSALIGPASVVAYDAGLKIFSLVLMTHTLVMTTLWSSFTHAQAAGEWPWIRQTLRRLVWLMLPLSGGCLALAAAAPWLVRVWLGPDHVAPWTLYGTMAVVTVVSCWSNIFASFHNGVGETRVQLITALVAMALNVPAAWFFVHVLDLGLAGVAAATLLSLSIFAVAGPLRTAQILAERGRG